MYVYNEFYRIGCMLSWLMFIEVNVHVDLCNCAWQVGNYLHTVYIKVATNEGWYLTSRYASKLIGGPLRWIFKTNGKLI